MTGQLFDKSKVKVERRGHFAGHFYCCAGEGSIDGRIPGVSTGKSSTIPG